MPTALVGTAGRLVVWPRSLASLNIRLGLPTGNPRFSGLPTSGVPGPLCPPVAGVRLLPAGERQPLITHDLLPAPSPLVGVGKFVLAPFRERLPAAVPDSRRRVDLSSSVGPRARSTPQSPSPRLDPSQWPLAGAPGGCPPACAHLALLRPLWPRFRCSGGHSCPSGNAEPSWPAARPASQCVLACVLARASTDPGPSLTP
jgi:hypothetical protein